MGNTLQKWIRKIRKSQVENEVIEDEDTDDIKMKRGFGILIMA